MVMEMGGRLRLVLKTPKVLGVEHGGEGEDFQSNSPAQGNLLRLIDDAHPAAADFAQQAEIAELACDGSAREPAQRRGQLIELPQTGEILLQVRREFGILSDEFLRVRLKTFLQGIDIAHKDLVQPFLSVGGFREIRRHGSAQPLWC